MIEHYRAVRLIHPFFYLFSARAAQYLIPEAAAWLRTTPQAVLLEYAILAFTIFSRLLFGISFAAIVVWEGVRVRPQWRRSVTIGLICLVLTSLGSFILIPRVKHVVGAYAFRDLDVHQAKVDLTSDEELYTWARTQTPKDSLFFYGSPLFRYRAQRSITHARGDLINHREARYVEIFRRYERLEKAYKDPAELIQAASSLTGKLPSC